MNILNTNISDLILLFREYGFIWIFISLLLPFIFNAQKVKDLFDTFIYAKHSKIRSKEIALKTDCLDNITRKVIERQISSDYFFQATGIKTNFYLRQAILLLHEYSQGEITLYILKKSLVHLTFEDKELRVNITTIDKKVAFIAGFIFWFFAVLAIALTSLLIISLIYLDISNITNSPNLNAVVTMLIYIPICLWIAFMFLGIYHEFKYAKKIKDYLISNKSFNKEFIKKHLNSVSLLDTDENNTN